MFGFSFWEIMMVLLVALVVLGPKRLPALAKSLGRGLRKLQQASGELKSAIEEPLEEVRRPLEDMRDDLMQTVHKFEGDIQREMQGVEGALSAKPAPGEEDPYADAEHDPYADPEHDAEHNPYAERDEDEEDLPTEIDDRRREVEALYASSAAEDAADDPLLDDADAWDPDVVGGDDDTGGEADHDTGPGAGEVKEAALEERVPAAPPTSDEEAPTTLGFAAPEATEETEAASEESAAASPADSEKATGA